jgi:D-tyrosyl-tRNA(Tyr) deacylase
MIGLLQRVSEARVEVAGVTIGAIENGLLVFAGVERGDSEATADRLLDRLLSYRVFADTDGKMNRSLRDVGGGLLLVPQFTLAADTTRGTRPSFTPAAPPEEGRRLFDHLVLRAGDRHGPVASGLFGADMQVKLTNNGPVTFWLRVPPGGTTEETDTKNSPPLG